MTTDIQTITEILEEMQDQQKAVALLKEFNQKSQEHHKLIANLDPDLDTSEWKALCDQAKLDLEKVVTEILSFKS